MNLGRATVEFQILTHVPMHLHLLWASDSLVLLSMLAILPTDLHNTYSFILLLFPPTVYCCASFPSYSKRVWQTLPLPMTFTLLNLLLPLLPWFFCCLPSSSAGKKTPFFWLRFWLLFFLNSHILFNYYWLFLAVVHTHCEMYAPELNRVLYKSIYQPHKDYLLFFSKVFSLFQTMVCFDLVLQKSVFLQQGVLLSILFKV